MDRLVGSMTSASLAYASTAAGAKNAPVRMAIATNPRMLIAIKVGQRRFDFGDLAEPWPFCKDRNDVAAGDGRRPCPSSSVPSYRGVESDRDNKGVISWSSSCWECFEIGLSLLPSNGEEGLSDIVQTRLARCQHSRETRRPA